MADNGAALSIQQEHETYVREDGTTFTRRDIFVKLSVAFRDRMLCKLKGPKLSVYLCIALHCSGEEMVSWPSIVTIEEETGYGHTAVIGAVKELEAMGLIEVEHRLKADGSADSNRYKVRGYATMGEGSSPSVPPVVHLVNGGSSPSGIEEESIEEEAREEAVFSEPAPAGGKSKERRSNGDSILEYDDPLSMAAEVARRRGDVPDWAVRGPEGVDPYYPALAAFCRLTRQAAPATKKMGVDWLDALGESATYLGLRAKELTDAIARLDKLKGVGWYLENGVWSSPRADSFTEKLGQLVGEMRAGTFTPAGGWKGKL